MKENTLKQCVNEFKLFINNKAYFIPVILVAIFSYGFVLTHYSINIDTLSANRYFEEGMLIGQGRLTATIIHKIFNIMEFNPFFVDGIAVVFLIISSTFFCVLLKRLTNNKLMPLSYTIFSCLFLSYPLINEIFVYTPASLSIALGFFFVSISLILILECINNFRKSYIVYTTLLLFLATSLYESFLCVYLVGLFIILILKSLISLNKIKIKDIIKEFCILLMPALISLLFSLILPKFVMTIFNIDANYNASKNISYTSLGLIGGIDNLIVTMIEQYYINGLFYLPITIFVLSNIICIFTGIFFSIKKKNYIFLLLFLGLMISTISLSIIQGEATSYRTCQTFPVFCSFLIMLIYNIMHKNSVLKTITTLFIILLIFYQAKNLHTIFYLNYIRYEEEKNTLTKVCNEIEMHHDTNKPVIFIGEYEFSDYITSKIYVKKEDSRMEFARNILKVLKSKHSIYDDDFKYIQTNVNAYLMWSQAAFREPNGELYKWLDILGYKFKQPDMETIYEAYDYIYDKGDIEKSETQIVEADNYIVVNI